MHATCAIMHASRVACRPRLKLFGCAKRGMTQHDVPHRPQVHTLVLFVTSPAGAGMKKVRSVHCRISDVSGAQPSTFVDYVWHSGRNKDEALAQVGAASPGLLLCLSGLRMRLVLQWEKLAEGFLHSP